MEKKHKKGSVRRVVTILIAIALISISAYNLYPIILDDIRTDQEYEGARDDFVRPHIRTSTPSPTPPPTIEPTEKEEEAEPRRTVFEDAEPPIDVDWDSLLSVNDDIVGWVYVDAQPGISYPIVQGETNDEYLHMTYKRSYLYAGSIFLSSRNARDFSDASSFVYGHNMRSGSMFGTLKYAMTQEKYDKAPYFWILTPNGNYRYHIFSMFTTTDGSFVYTHWESGGKQFRDWLEDIRAMSIVKTEVELFPSDKVVALSTCQGSGTQYRNVIMGVLVSSVQPPTT